MTPRIVNARRKPLPLFDPHGQFYGKAVQACLLKWRTKLNEKYVLNKFRFMAAYVMLEKKEQTRPVQAVALAIAISDKPEFSAELLLALHQQSARAKWTPKDAIILFSGMDRGQFIDARRFDSTAGRMEHKEIADRVSWIFKDKRHVSEGYVRKVLHDEGQRRTAIDSLWPSRGNRVTGNRRNQ